MDLRQELEALRKEQGELTPRQELEMLRQEQGELSPRQELEMLRQEQGEISEPGALEQLVTGITDPFGSSEKQYDKATQEKAREFLKQQGYDPDSIPQSALTSLMGLADTLSFGFSPAIASKVYGIPEDVYRAAYAIRKEEQPAAAGVGEFAGYVAPGAGIKSLSKGLLYGAGQAVGVGVQRAEEGKEAEEVGRALVGEAIGFGMGKLISEGIGAGAKITKKQAAKVLVNSGFDSKQAEKVAEVFDRQKKVYDDKIKTVKDLSDTQAQDFRKNLLDGIDPEHYTYGDLSDALDDYRSILARQEAVLEAGVDPETLGKGWLGKVAKFFTDSQYVADAVDRRWGTDFMRTMNKGSEKYNNALHISKDLKQTANRTLKQFKIKDIEDSKQLIKNIEKGVRGEREDAYREMFRNLGTKVNKTTRTNAVELRDDYVPHYTKNHAEVTGILRNRINRILGSKSPKIDTGSIQKLRQDTELMDSIRYLGRFRRADDVQKMNKRFAQELEEFKGTAKDKKKLLRTQQAQLARSLGKVDEMTDDALLKFIPSIYSTQGLRTIDDSFTDLSATSIRQRLNENVPDLIREFDMGKLLGGWTNSVPMDIMMRPEVRKIKSMALGLRDQDREAFNYMQAYVNDLGNIRRGLAGVSQEISRRFATSQHQKAQELRDQATSEMKRGNKQKANSLIKSAKRREGIANLPQFGQFLQAQMYPAFLGLRPDAVLRNTTQPFAYTIQQVTANPTYKAKLAAKNSIKSAYALRNKKALRELEQRGLMPPDPTPGAFRELSKGIEATQGAGSRALEKSNNIAMAAYQASDLVNRIVTMNVAKDVAADVLKNNKHAWGYLERLPSSYRRPALAALKNKDLKALEDLFIDHLNATTQFNYNRASMSEYGRFMGSAFNMFSKWPTAILGDIINTIDAQKLSEATLATKLSRGSAQLANKYLGPAVGLMVLDSTLGYETPLNEITDLFDSFDSPQRDVFAGRSGFGSSAPITSATGILTHPEQQFTPPIFAAISDLLGGKVDTFMGILPGYVWARFLTERLTPMVSDEPGQKPTEALLETME